MINRTREEEYAKHFKRFGSGQENIHQTLAICSIADMLTAIACDIRALRENADRKGETR